MAIVLATTFYSIFFSSEFRNGETCVSFILFNYVIEILLENISRARFFFFFVSSLQTNERIVGREWRFVTILNGHRHLTAHHHHHLSIRCEIQKEKWKFCTLYASLAHIYVQFGTFLIRTSSP